MREAVGEHRDAGHDHHQRQAHHREDRVAVGEGSVGRLPAVCRGRGHSRLHGWHSLSRVVPAGRRSAPGSGTVSRSDSDAASATIWRHPPVCKGVFGMTTSSAHDDTASSLAAPRRQRADAQPQLRPSARSGAGGVRRARPRRVARGDRPSRRGGDRHALPALPHASGAARSGVPRRRRVGALTGRRVCCSPTRRSTRSPRGCTTSSNKPARAAGSRRR